MSNINWQHSPRPRISKSEHVALNIHILKTLDRAAQCANWLVAQGFEVLGVSVGRRNPRVEIAPTRLCEQLDGIVHMTERHFNLPTRRYWVAIRFGCEVRWADEVRS